MQKIIRNLTLLSLGFPLGLTACSLPGNPSLDTVQESKQASGELLVRFSGFEAQSLASIEYIDLAVRMPQANFSYTKRVFAEDLKQALDLSLKGIPVGSAELHATMFKRDKSSIVRMRAVQIDPGMSTAVAFDFYANGDSASDLVLEYNSASYRDFVYTGPYKSEFYIPYSTYNSLDSFARNYQFTAGGTTKTVTYRQAVDQVSGGYSMIRERLIDGQRDGSTFNPQLFYTVPPHAEFVADLDTYAGFGKVRHLRFTNAFKQGDVWKNLTVDRYFAVEIGLVHEIISEDGQQLSELTLLPSVPTTPGGNK